MDLKKCPTCNRKYKTNEKLEKHKETCQGGVSVLLNCRFCNKKYRSENSLKVHEEQHARERERNEEAERERRIRLQEQQNREMELERERRTLRIGELRQKAEQRDLEAKTETSDCVVCYDARANMALVDCGHVALCDSCIETYIRNTLRCPVCRKEIKTPAIRVFHV